MWMRRFLPALLLALPALALAQQPATPSPLETMKANARSIVNAAERERWNANVRLWTIELAQPGPVANKDLAKMSQLLEQMRLNVGKIRVTTEKERWDANVEMWRVLIEHRGVLASPAAATLAPVFARMKANVAEIAQPAERERWMANCDLWQSVMARAAAAF